MKKIIIILLLMLPLATFAQDSTYVDNKFTYKLYPTKNMWTFLKLNTADGRIWQVQYDIDGNNRFETYINFDLVFGSDVINGRFELYPTQNMYNFILLDKINGRMWQVQWSMEKKGRLILPIN